MDLNADNVLLRVFVDEFKHWHHAPVYEAIVRLARKRHLAGATVLEGIEGFGQSGKILKEHAWLLANNREVIVEIVDKRDKVEAFLVEIEPMLEDAMVTMEAAHVVFYRGGKRHS